MIVPSSGDGARDLDDPRESTAFDAARAWGHAERLNFPRRVGTPRERRAARYAERAFDALGLAWRREPFAVPWTSRVLCTQLAFAAGAAAVLAGIAVAATRPLPAAGLWLLAAALAHAPWRLARSLPGRWPSGLVSRNLVATWSDPAAGDAPARVVFMAHYDTKSQLLPTGVRVGLVVAATAGCLLLGAWGCAAWAGLAPPTAAAGGLAVPAALCLVALALNVTGNRSPGALDNATGLGALLELARCWRPRAEAPIEVVWVATGAEELGLVGARDFLRRHEAWWRAKPTLLINLDSVGAGERVYLAGERGALQLAQATADGLGVSWARLRAVGAGMDHEPFAARGLPAFSILGDVVGRSLALHSARDTLDRVEREAIGRAGRLAAQVAWAWAGRDVASAPGGAGATPRAAPLAGRAAEAVTVA